MMMILLMLAPGKIYPRSARRDAKKTSSILKRALNFFVFLRALRG
jgi:hypothetical protein